MAALVRFVALPPTGVPSIPVAFAARKPCVRAAGEGSAAQAGPAHKGKDNHWPLAPREGGIQWKSESKSGESPGIK